MWSKVCFNKTITPIYVFWTSNSNVFFAVIITSTLMERLSTRFWNVATGTFSFSLKELKIMFGVQVAFNFLPKIFSRGADLDKTMFMKQQLYSKYILYSFVFPTMQQQCGVGPHIRLMVRCQTFGYVFYRSYILQIMHVLLNLQLCLKCNRSLVIWDIQHFSENVK